jgi:hypothetical protein
MGGGDPVLVVVECNTNDLVRGRERGSVVSSTRGTHSLPPLDLPDSDWLRSFLTIPIFQ